MANEIRRGEHVIDSATKAEELALEWTIRNVKCAAGEIRCGEHEKDGVVISPKASRRGDRRIEDYGFGKGYQSAAGEIRRGEHVYETFLPLLSDLDPHVRAGRNVVLISPQRVAVATCTTAPRRCRTPRARTTSARHSESPSRQERPWCMAKSRTLADPVELIQFDTTLWNKLLAREAE